MATLQKTPTPSRSETFPRLKPQRLVRPGGTTKVVPYPNPCLTQSVPYAIRATQPVPYSNSHLSQLEVEAIQILLAEFRYFYKPTTKRCQCIDPTSRKML
jgi:hypothetical protein